ncbi:hypothetical protein KP509_31G064900 [Ceratopteris richardii]|uniref:Glycerophosphocholine acyltransferase 1 n=1 Tax=Ceratopteris richardii TaxID=49495 RepID=A0A8T2QYM7_CERRI|nr:hypothetical protein KP509_31G064900 [Ceratopteris richardii]
MHVCSSESSSHPLDRVIETMLKLGKYSVFSSPIPVGGISKTQKLLSNQAHLIAKQADKYENLLNKVTYLLGVLSFGMLCYLLGSKPQEIPRLYCVCLISVVPLRWMYYRTKKWHYYLLDFCYYANTIFVSMLLFFPNNKKLFMLCFSFSEGPLAWALIVWRCSLVFSSIDKIISVLIHLLPGTVFFILRWWESNTLSEDSSASEDASLHTWPVVKSIPAQWIWLFFVPLIVYCIWQGLYFLVVEGLRRKRILSDPEIMTSYRELKRKAQRANNIWWRLSGLLGDANRVYMYAILQAVFTIATMVFTVPMFRYYRLHAAFEVFKLAATVWYGGNFIFEVMPRQAVKKLTRDAETEQKTREELTRSIHGGEFKDPNFDATPSENLKHSQNLVMDALSTDDKLELCILCQRRSPRRARRQTVNEFRESNDNGGPEWPKFMVKQLKMNALLGHGSAEGMMKWIDGNWSVIRWSR